MENAVAGRGWQITTVAGEKLSNQIKNIPSHNLKMPVIYLQIMLRVRSIFRTLNIFSNQIALHIYIYTFSFLVTFGY